VAAGDEEKGRGWFLGQNYLIIISHSPTPDDLFSIFRQQPLSRLAHKEKVLFFL
jgi:hypothetical protein